MPGQSFDPRFILVRAREDRHRFVYNIRMVDLDELYLMSGFIG
jgi:hypothetical protein